MKLLVMPRAGLQDIRSRSRIYQFLPALVAEGFQIHVLPPNPLRALSSWRQNDYEIALIEENVFPHWPLRLRRLLAKRLPPARAVIEPDEHDPLVSSGARVTGHILESPGDESPCCLRLPPSVDWQRLGSIERKRLRRRLLWMGRQPSELQSIAEHLSILQATHAFTLVSVGQDPGPLPFPSEHHKRLPVDPVNFLQNIDLTLLPTQTEALTFEQRHAFNLSAAAALPVVCGHHPEWVEALALSNAGTLVEDNEDWFPALRKLMEKHALRRVQGERGRRWAKHERGLRTHAPRLASFLRRLIAAPSS